MFPIIGPVKDAGYAVQVPRGNAILDQHGHLRLLEYDLISHDDTHATYKKVYKAGTPVKNGKFPENSNKALLMWPYSFEFEKRFELKPNRLEVTFILNAERDMPYMIGYHPAFKLYTENPVLKTDSREIPIQDVLAVGHRALQVADCESITLHDQKEVKIETEGFGHFMCWTMVPNMVCIEPISFYPYAVEQRELHTGFDYTKDSEVVFKTIISV